MLEAKENTIADAQEYVPQGYCDLLVSRDLRRDGSVTLRQLPCTRHGSTPAKRAQKGPGRTCDRQVGMEDESTDHVVVQSILHVRPQEITVRQIFAVWVPLAGLPNKT